MAHYSEHTISTVMEGKGSLTFSPTGAEKMVRVDEKMKEA